MSRPTASVAPLGVNTGRIRKDKGKTTWKKELDLEKREKNWEEKYENTNKWQESDAIISSKTSEVSSETGWYPKKPIYLKNEIRIVVIGKTGTGKSRTGNMILGKGSFKFAAKAGSVTSHCSWHTAERFGHKLCIIDTPGLFDTGKENDVMLSEIQKCLHLAAPGPHAFLLIVSLGRFTEEEYNTVKEFQKHFGEAMMQYLIVLFTRMDDLEEYGQTLDEYVKDESVPENLSKLLEDIGNRYVGFNNKLKFDEGEKQVKELLALVEKMDQANGGSFYFNETFNMAEAMMQWRMDEVRKEEEQKRLQELQDQERKFEERLQKIKEQYQAEIDKMTKSVTQLSAEDPSLAMDVEQNQNPAIPETARETVGEVAEVAIQKEYSSPADPTPVRAPVAPPTDYPFKTDPEDVYATVMKATPQTEVYKIRLEELGEEKLHQEREVEEERETLRLENDKRLRDIVRDEVKAGRTHWVVWGKTVRKMIALFEPTSELEEYISQN